MKKEKKIMEIRFVRDCTNYFVFRTMRVLKLKLKDFDHMSIDLHPTERTVWVWVHAPDKIIARAQFFFNGRCYCKVDNRLDEEGEK